MVSRRGWHPHDRFAWLQDAPATSIEEMRIQSLAYVGIDTVEDGRLKDFEALATNDRHIQIRKPEDVIDLPPNTHGADQPNAVCVFLRV